MTLSFKGTVTPDKSMGTICGILYIQRFSESSLISVQLGSMVNRLNHWNCKNIHRYSDSCAGMASMQIYEGKATKNIGYLEDTVNQLIVLSDSTITNRKTLLSKLCIETCIGNEISDVQLIKECWLKWDKEIANHMDGEFVVSVYDKKINSLFVCRDHMGTKPLFIFHDKEMFIFSTEIKGILGAINMPFEINDNFIYTILSNQTSDKEQTIYKNISRLKPGHYIVVDASGELTVKEYWTLKPQEVVYYKKEQDYVGHFDEVLKSAISDRIPSESPVGFELSGGLDSSAVLGAAANITQDYKRRLHTFSHVLNDKSFFPYSDETGFINKITGHLDISPEYKHFIDTDRSLLETIRESVSIQDSPIQQRLHLLSDALYENACGNGIHHLFSGFGGDEMVSSGPGGFFAFLAKEKQYVKLLSEMALWGIIQRKEVVKRYLRLLKASWTNSIVFKGIVFSKTDFLVEPYAIKPELLSVLEKFVLENESVDKAVSDFITNQIERVMASHVTQRMEYCHIAALHRQVNYHYPLLDKQLLELYMAFPAHVKFKHGYDRYLLRKSSERYLPSGIAWRTIKMSNTIPYANKRFLKDKVNILEFLNYCGAKKIGEEFIDISKMKVWLGSLMTQSGEYPRKNLRFGAFINYLSLLVFLDTHS